MGVQEAMDQLLAGAAGQLGGAAWSINAATMFGLRSEPAFRTAFDEPGPAPDEYGGLPIELDFDLADGVVVLGLPTEPITAQAEGPWS